MKFDLGRPFFALLVVLVVVTLSASAGAMCPFSREIHTAPSDSPLAIASFTDPLEEFNLMLRDTIYPQAAEKLFHDRVKNYIVSSDMIRLYVNHTLVDEMPPNGEVYDTLKMLDHFSLATFVACAPVISRDNPSEEISLTTQVTTSLKSILRSVEAVAPTLAERKTVGLKDSVQTILNSTSRFIRGVLQSLSVSQEKVDNYLVDIEPEVLKLVDAATNDNVESFIAATKKWKTQFLPDMRDWDSIWVAVTGGHQARKRALAIQYYESLLKVSHDSGRRILYVEGSNDIDSIRRSMGVHLLDSELSLSLFSSSGRMHEDLLASFAEAILFQNGHRLGLEED